MLTRMPILAIAAIDRIQSNTFVKAQERAKMTAEVIDDD